MTITMALKFCVFHPKTFYELGPGRLQDQTASHRPAWKLVLTSRHASLPRFSTDHLLLSPLLWSLKSSTIGLKDGGALILWSIKSFETSTACLHNNKNNQVSLCLHLLFTQERRPESQNLQTFENGLHHICLRVNRDAVFSEDGDAEHYLH